MNIQNIEKGLVSKDCKIKQKILTFISERDNHIEIREYRKAAQKLYTLKEEVYSILDINDTVRSNVLNFIEENEENKE